MSKYSVTKDVSETYRLRIDSYRCQWANITINPNGEFSVISDCGNFNNRWPMSANENFKEFLVRICSKSEKNGYLYDKIHDRDRASRVDAEKSVIPLKQELFRYYREKKRDSYYMMQDKKKIYPQLETRMRDAFDELESIGNEGEMSVDAFCSLLWYNNQLGEVFDGDYLAHALDVETIGDRQAMAFCEVVAPLFAEVLEVELGEESSI